MRYFFSPTESQTVPESITIRWRAGDQMVKQVLHHRVAKQHKVRQQPMFCLPSM